MTPLFAKPSIVAEERADGTLVVRSTQPLADHPHTILASFRSWAEKDPDHVLATERRADGQRDALTYGDAASTARAVGEGLIQLGLGPERPLLLLSGNSIAHLTVLLGALTAGVPVCPISVAYSLQSRDHARIKEIAELTTPGAVFAEDVDQFGDALAAVAGVPAIVCRSTQPNTIALDQLIATKPGAAVDEAYARLESSSLAKILFTSGSTGSPKGVLTTHGMLAANQQQIRQAWPFLETERPVVVDWLPWSHTFGGSHNVGLILVSGGTLHIDDGRPARGLFDQSIQNLVDNPPTIYFNVPAGFAQLVPVLESDPEFAARFFSRLRLVFNAAAALPDGLRDRLHDVAERTTGLPIPVTGSWGLTETAPAVTNAHYDFSDARTIGVPLPGADLKLVPVADAYEIRVRGPMVTPGYLNRPDLTKTSFDEEGFYLTGDAVQFSDPDDLDLGLLFRGRLAEDFKLTTGTFVRVGEVDVVGDPLGVVDRA
ncbi:MAG: AMP-binding protein, partial [Nocardioidaceae bacterium]